MRLLLFVAALLPQLTQVPPPAPVPMPPALRARFVEDMRTKNLEDVLALYAPGATFHDPEGHDISSASALRTLYTQVFNTYDSDITLAQPKNEIIGAPRPITAMRETGTYRETLRLRTTGVATVVCGTYTFEYAKNTAGVGWLISSMAWTNDPCPAPATP